MSIDKVNGMLEEKQIRTIIDLYANQLQYKIVNGNDILCVFSVFFLNQLFSDKKNF